MKNQWLVVAFLTLFVNLHAFSQSICSFDKIHRREMETNPEYRNRVRETERYVADFVRENEKRLTARTNGKTESVLYTIPVVVHVIHTGGAVGSIYNPTDAQIQGAINYLNQVYNGTYPGTQGIGDIQIQFVLAKLNTACGATTAINRVDGSGVAGYTANGVNAGSGLGADEVTVKNLSRWNNTQYYNIWVVNKIDGNDGTSGTFTAGFAYFPGTSAAKDGTIMLATQMIAGQKTLPHEIGHAFGLYHTFQGSSDNTTCPANTDCTVDGDAICDTDPVTLNSTGGVLSFACRTGTNTCTGTAYSINTESNYMSYTNCYTLFTAGQKARLLAFAGSTYRKSLSTSIANSATYPAPSFSSPINASCSPATGATGLSNNYAGLANVSVSNRDFPSSSSKIDNGYVNGATNCMNIIALVKGTTYTFSANTWGANNEQIRAWIDYNNDGVFDNVTEQIHYNTLVPNSNPTTSGTFTVPSTATAGTMLRMRVMDEIGTISSGCYAPTYGQAEDYPVYLTNSVLPIVLVKFGAQLNDDHIDLTWYTGSEQNSKDFTIEKSVNGSDFYKIGTVAAVNSSTITHQYGFSDPDVNETNYYRLRMNDMDGKNTLSYVVVVKSGAIRDNGITVTNPFRSTLQIKMPKVNGVVHLELVSQSGSLIATKDISAPGNQINWSVPASLSRGMYILKIQTEKEVFTQKVIKE
ncbi:MAG TPA: zinc-dependent metalloprotease [Flavisolibacter sp.]|jgi:hypothetical protein|nr:zinc-dependent metalloprotease [Flavisolibacter sp.]